MGRANGSTGVDHVEASWVDDLERRLRAAGAILVAGSTPLPLSPVGEAALADALARRGFERTARYFRIPLEAQTAMLMQREGPVALAELPNRLAGGTRPELPRLVRRLVQTKQAVLFVRDGEDHLGPPSTEVLDEDDVRRLKKLLVELRAAIAPLEGRRGPPARSLRAEDVRPLFSSLAFLSQAATGAQQKGDPIEVVVAALAQLEEPGTALVFIPHLAARLRKRFDPRALKAALIAAAHARRLELRPESGVGRLAPEDLELCPLGPAGVVLSYARRLAPEGDRG